MRKLLFLLFFKLALASNVGNFFHVIEPVADFDSLTINQAKLDALKKIYIKYSGTRNILNNVEVQKSLLHYNDFVESYSYIDSDEKFVDIEFNRNLLDQFLDKANVRAWEVKLRPGFAIIVQSADVNLNNINSVVKAWSNHRGLKSTFLEPRLSYHDFFENWNGITDSLVIDDLQARARGKVPLVIKVSDEATSIFYWLHGVLGKVSVRSEDFQFGLNEALDQLADIVANKMLAVNAPQVRILPVTILNIKRFNDLMKVTKLFSAQPGVLSCRVVNVNFNQAILELEIDGSVSDLMQTMQSQTIVKQDNDSSDVVYRWNGL